MIRINDPKFSTGSNPSMPMSSFSKTPDAHLTPYHGGLNNGNSQASGPIAMLFFLTLQLELFNLITFPPTQPYYLDHITLDDNSPIILGSIYLPANRQIRLATIPTLPEHLPSSLLLLGGDINIICNPALDHYPAQNRSTSNQWLLLQEKLQHWSLGDLLRHHTYTPWPLLALVISK